IGGPTLIRAAAKNFEHVIVVVDPEDYAPVAEALARGGCDRAMRYRLATEAFAHTAAYDAAIVGYLSRRETPEAQPSPWPAYYAAVHRRRLTLRYGENPHQSAAFYLDREAPGEPAVASAEVLQGKPLSFNNLVDADAALELLKEFEACAAVVVKHTNPCGVAVGGEDLATTYRMARACDETSAFGGIVALNRAVDPAAAEALAETFLEIVVAPGFDEEARGILAKKKNLRLLQIPSLGEAPEAWRRGGLDLKKVGGGLLLQDRDVALFAPEGPRVVSQRAPTDAEWRALHFAWRCCKHVKSNAIVFATAQQLVGVGAGQMSRVDAVRIAALRASLPLEGTVVASDAFFPFRDGVDVAAEAGATAVIQPGGSRRDEEVIAAADAHGMAMVFTGMRHFKH
ncbi:MAG: bifunctional phosphoribosylaminoimidazolecarboxamide formyltransferase/IMP cyclohydrolase PurH, partial [Deltaproteobacteria bacterium]